MIRVERKNTKVLERKCVVNVQMEHKIIEQVFGKFCELGKRSKIYIKK